MAKATKKSIKIGEQNYIFREFINQERYDRIKNNISFSDFHFVRCKKGWNWYTTYRRT